MDISRKRVFSLGNGSGPADMVHWNKNSSSGHIPAQQFNTEHSISTVANESLILWPTSHATWSKELFGRRQLAFVTWDEDGYSFVGMASDNRIHVAKSLQHSRHA